MYILEVLNTSLTRTALITYRALFKFEYEVELNAPSAMAFTIRADLGVTLERDYIINVWRADTLMCSYLITNLRYYTDGAEYLTVGGSSLEILLKRRIIYPPDDPLAAGGYSTKAGVAEVVMHDYVYDHCVGGSRPFPGLVMGTNWGRGDTVGLRLRHENLLEKLQELAKKYKVDFRVIFQTGQLVFETETYGRNRTVTTNDAGYYMVSVERGNMVDPQLELDYRDARNFVFALGVGQGDFRDILPVSTADAVETPYARVEFVTESGTSEPGSNLELYTEALTQLYEARPKRKITYDLPEGLYGSELILGDTFTARYRGFQEDVRLTKVTISYEQGLEKITPTMEVNDD